MTDNSPLEAPPRRRPPRSLKPFVGLAGLAVVVAALLLWNRTPEVELPAALEPAPAAAVAQEVPALPPLGERDARFRDAAGRLSAHPELTRWLSAADLVRRFVGAVYAISEGRSPTEQLSGVLPQARFAVIKHKGRLVADPKRTVVYDVVASVLATLDERVVADAYRGLEPIFDAAYAEIAPPGARFSEALAKALAHLEATPVPDEPPSFTRVRLHYAFSDRQLESLSPAQKQLLRLGVDNARRIKSELRGVARALGMAPESVTTNE